MSPKDLAKDLYNKFLSTTDFMKSPETRQKQAKLLAKMCLKEIIEHSKQQYKNTTSLHFYETDQYKFYKKTEVEIVNLPLVC